MLGERLFFRTRGGPTQGWGNVVRLASFAGACRARGCEDLTFFAEGPPEVHAYLRERGFAVVALPDEVTWKDEVAAYEAAGRSSVTVVEMLDVTPERQALLRRFTDRLVVFDDLCDHVYDADLVVCGQALPSYGNRELSAQETRFLLGYDYFLCRPEFLEYADRARAHRSSVERVLVTLGGGAYDVGYLKAAHALAALGYPLEATFVLGPGKLKTRARILELLPDAHVLDGVDDLEQRMWDCDLAIVSAGYTKLEAALTRTPALMMSAQWHQLPLAAEFQRASGMPDLGYIAYVEIDTLVAELRRLEPAAQREGAAERARQAVDGRGFERVFDVLCALPEAV